MRLGCVAVCPCVVRLFVFVCSFVSMFVCWFADDHDDVFRCVCVVALPKFLRFFIFNSSHSCESSICFVFSLFSVQ